MIDVSKQVDKDYPSKLVKRTLGKDFRILDEEDVKIARYPLDIGRD